MNEQPARLDLDHVIRAARLRSSRAPAAALVSVLFQAVHAVDPSARLRARAIVDEGRSVKEVMFGIEQAGQLWTINGQGDWQWQKDRALSRNSQTWKNPELREFPEYVQQEIEKSVLGESYPLLEKVQARIASAMSSVVAENLSASAPSPPDRKKSPRF